MQRMGYPWTWEGLEQCTMDLLQARGSSKEAASTPERWETLSSTRLGRILRGAAKVVPTEGLHARMGCAIRALTRIAISTGAHMPPAQRLIATAAGLFSDSASTDATVLAPSTRSMYFASVASFLLLMVGLTREQMAAATAMLPTYQAAIRATPKRARKNRPAVPREVFSRLTKTPREELVLRAFGAAVFDGVVRPASLLNHPSGSMLLGAPITLSELTTCKREDGTYDACIRVQLRSGTGSMQLVFSSEQRTRLHHPRAVGAARLLHQLRLARYRAGAADGDPLWTDSEGKLLTLDALTGAMVRLGAARDTSPDSVFRAVEADAAAFSGVPLNKLTPFGRWRREAKPGSRAAAPIAAARPVSARGHGRASQWGRDARPAMTARRDDMFAFSGAGGSPGKSM